ncbi:hypothetical protein NECAME_13729 [Necator americanus]|uniref:Uncharacterized protein n=1 Tax=Necator americanus TaxID=51031 RepID=W2SSS6_NECAM|nr:hypothetical protein NECAME_13729 [Necator americanus]ETN72779.1 hypothetical protein NECAME_13729 [Necator americanus]
MTTSCLASILMTDHMSSRIESNSLENSRNGGAAAAANTNRSLHFIAMSEKEHMIDRERQRLQHEVIELTATIDQVQKDKTDPLKNKLEEFDFRAR